MSATLNQEPTAETRLEIVHQKVEAMRFGSVHEGRVTKVESTEKTRLPEAPQPEPHRQQAK